MKTYIRYGSIALMIASLILTNYQTACGAVLFIFYNGNKTALLYLLRGNLTAFVFLLLFYQKELKQLYLKHKVNTSGSLEQTPVQKKAFLLDISTAVKNSIARVLTPVERFSLSL